MIMKWERCSLVVIIFVMFLLVAVIKDACADEWTYSGICTDFDKPTEDKKYEIKIHIYGRPGDKTFKVKLDGGSFNSLYDFGTYYTAGGRIRTREFDCNWDTKRNAFVIKRARTNRVIGYCKGATPPPGFTLTPTNGFVGTWSTKIGVKVIVREDNTCRWDDSRPNMPGSWEGKWSSTVNSLTLTANKGNKYGNSLTLTLQPNGTMTDPWSNVYSKSK